MFDCRRSALDIRAMALEEDSDLVGLLISPTEVISEVVAISPEESRSARVGIDAKSSPALLRNSGKETVGEKHGEDDQSEIGFQRRAGLAGF